MNKIYLTTAIPYMNGNPHIGHAMDYCLADVCARYHRLLGDEVRFQVGTDEHGSKIAQKAASLNAPVEDFVTEKSENLRDFIKKLNVEYTDFIRTTDPDHTKRCQAIWQKLSPFIYKASYEGWYCNGCERFITNKEYAEHSGVCPDHQSPYLKLKEENYYLKISEFKDKIIRAIESGEMEILPDSRKKQVLNLLENTPDVSISRPVSQLTWGVPVPNDPSQTMYVWIDALSNYITVLGYPDRDISDFWPATAQFIGKDILRFHAIIWPAMLLGLGLPLPKTLVSHGFILSGGQKMSKSVGNTVDPLEVIARYGTDAFRYYFLRHVDTFNDGDFTWEKFTDAYNGELANDLGNLVQRLSTLAAKNHLQLSEITPSLSEEYQKLMNTYNFQKAFDFVWQKVQDLNRRIDEEKPWALAKSGETEKLTTCLTGLARDLVLVSDELSPFLPETAAKIRQIFQGEVTPPKTPLFPKN